MYFKNAADKFFNTIKPEYLLRLQKY